MHKTYIVLGWTDSKDVIKSGVERYWPIRHQLAMTDAFAMKSKQIIIPYILQKQILEQLHSNQKGIEKMWLLARESVYWTNINANRKHTVKQCAT